MTKTPQLTHSVFFIFLSLMRYAVINTRKTSTTALVGVANVYARPNSGMAFQWEDSFAFCCICCS